MPLTLSNSMKLRFAGIALAWGTSFYLIKISLESFSPIEITFLRSFLGFLTLFMWCKIKRISIPKPSRLWLHLGILSVLLNSAPSFLFAKAETQLSSTLAGLINATTPAITILLVSVILRTERVSRTQVFGLLVSFVGISILVEVWKGFGESSLSSVLALFAAVSCFAISYPYIRKFLISRDEPIEGMITIQLAISSISLLPIYIIFDPFVLDVITAPLFSILALGVFASGIAYVWNTQVISYYGSARASSVSYLIPVVALVSGFFFLGENPTSSQLIGGAVILLGIWLSRESQTSE
jgi:drug/metabolite transporter (DMT)-like permease